MNDIIKEFNMISLLGILLPGALLTALFGTEFGLWERTCDYFGVTMSTGLVSTILIIAGFAFGTLLHELGDLMEKLLWSSKLLSPKTYASIRSGYAEHYLHRSDAALKAQAELESEDEPFTLRTALALSLLMGGGMAALLGGWWFLAGLLGWLVLLDRKGRIYRSWVCTMVPGSVDRTVLCLRAIGRSNAVMSFDLAARNSENQKHLDAVMRKRDLFEGFKAMARNLMLALILLGVYGAYTGGILHDIRGDILEDGAAKVVISMSIMLLLALRYYHYSYLKYKYSYEDLLAVEREQEAQAVQKPQESGPQRVAVELTVHRDRSEAVNL